MKLSILSIIFIVYAIGFSSCAAKRHVVGTWKVYSKGDYLNEEYDFQKNGTLEIKRPEQDLEVKNWEFSKKNKSIAISNEGNSESELFIITYLDAFFLNLSDDNDAIFLSRQLKIKSLDYARFRKKLKGEWSLVKRKDIELNSAEQPTFIFWDNGVYQEILSEEASLGRWSLSDDQTQMTLSNENYTQSMNVSFTKKNKLQLTDEHSTYLFEKTNKIRKSPSNNKVAKKIIGDWQLNHVEEKSIGEDGTLTLYLNEDGSLKIFESQHISNIGQWYVSEDGAFLVLEYSDEQIHYPIKSISTKKLVLLDDFQNVTFNRIKE